MRLIRYSSRRFVSKYDYSYPEIRRVRPRVTERATVGDREARTRSGWSRSHLDGTRR